MGQQQLLLIVLGVIIVGIAVVVGINLFNANAEEAAKDGVVSDCTNLGAMAQQHYKKPAAMGGGGNSFVNWDVPSSLVRTANMSEDVTIDAQTQDGLTLTATSTEAGVDGDPFTVTMEITKNEIDTTYFSNF